MQTAGKVAAGAPALCRIAENLAILNRLLPGDVAVFSGSYNRVEDILSCLNVPALRQTRSTSRSYRVRQPQLS